MEYSKTCTTDRILIIHESDGRPYFHFFDGKPIIATYWQASSFRIFIKNTLINKTGLSVALGTMLRSLYTRIQQLYIKTDHLILCFAPYDFRIIYYLPIIIRSKRVIYHTSWPFWWTDRIPRNYYLLNFALRNFYKVFLSWEKVTTVCVTRSTYQTIGKSARKRLVIPHAIKIKTAKERKPTQQRLQIGYIGKLISEKGVLEYTELALSMKDYIFHIAGDGYHRDKVSEIAKKSRSINYHGYLESKEAILQFYDTIDILILPSLRIRKWEELFGQVIIEAMSRGCVCICTDHTGPKSILTNGHNGYIVNEKKIQSESKKLILELDCDRSTFQKLSQNAITDSLIYQKSQIRSEWFKLLGINAK